VAAYDGCLSLQTFLEWFTKGAIVLLAILMAGQWAKWRDRVSFDIALVFGSLALLIVIESALQIAHVEARWIRPFGVSVLLAHPYLLLRVVSHFRLTSRTVMQAALLGLLVSLAAVWLPASPRYSPPAAAFALGYFMWLLAYVALAFRRGAIAAGGVTHWRMLHAGWGALLLAVVFALAVLIGLVPVSRSIVGAFIPLAAIGAALNYYFAFAPPPWIRRVWQSAELYGLLSEATFGSQALTQDETLARLSRFAMSAVGATGAAAALENERHELIVRASRWGYLEPGRAIPEGRLLEAWRSDTAMLVREYEWVLPGGAPGSVYVVPIPSKVAARGLLVVVLPKGALFVGDDLALLRLCCREAAVQLDNAVLAEQQQALINELEHRGDQLSAVNKELEAFSYSVSHDLRAPLRHISGFTDLLERSAGAELDPTRKRYLRLISESALKMGELIDALLVFSRMGRTEMMHTRVDLNGLVQNAKRDVIAADPARNVEWMTHPLPEVPGDPGMLQLVFTNLLSNAFKYSRHTAKAIIEIGVSDAGVEAGEVVIFVRDNGVGFDMAYANRLFGVFQRLHKVEDFEGTGIGLANVQRIVLRHGGRVWAESDPGVRTTFYVALPTERESIK
jgi:signal transduction histidine kinase